MTCLMWAPWDSRTAWRRNTNFHTTRVSIPLVTCAQLDPLLQCRQSSGSTAEHFFLQIIPEEECEGSAASYHRIHSPTLSAFLGTQLSETGRHGSCTDTCVDWFEVCTMLSEAIPHFLRLSHRLQPWRWGHTCTNGPNSVWRANMQLAPASFLACHIPSCTKLLHQRLHRIPCWCFLALVLVFELWQSNLFAETIPHFEFSALSLVAEPFWMMSQWQVLPSMEKILLYHDYGTTTYIELCTFSVVYLSTKIDSHWLKHHVF